MNNYLYINLWAYFDANLVFKNKQFSKKSFLALKYLIIKL